MIVNVCISDEALTRAEWLAHTYGSDIKSILVCPPCLGANHPTHVWCGECGVMDVIVDGALGRIEREAAS